VEGARGLSMNLSAWTTVTPCRTSGDSLFLFEPLNPASADSRGSVIVICPPAQPTASIPSCPVFAPRASCAAMTSLVLSPHAGRGPAPHQEQAGRSPRRPPTNRPRLRRLRHSGSVRACMADEHRYLAETSSESLSVLRFWSGTAPAVWPPTRSTHLIRCLLCSVCVPNLSMACVRAGVHVSLSRKSSKRQNYCWRRRNVQTAAWSNT
jgi:hypothetical protein